MLKQRTDGECIKEFREIMGFTKQKLADICGVSPSLINELESGRTKKANMKIYEGIFSVMKLEDTHKFSDDFLKFISKYPQKEETMVEVPYYEDVKASMGNGIINHDSSVRKISFDLSFLKDVYQLYCTKNLSLINAHGDSMSPTIPSDSIVIVQNTDIPDGSICAVLLDGELYVKRIQKRPALKLISDNKAYDDIYVNEHDAFQVIGKVVGVMKRI